MSLQPQLKNSKDSPNANLKPRFSWFTDRRLANLFIFPTLIILFFVTLYPLIWSLIVSFADWSIIKNAGEARTYVGVENYSELLGSDRAWQRFVITGKIVGASVFIELILGFGIAMLLNRKFAGRSVMMTLMLVPMMLSPVVVALFWRFMMQGNGVLNYYIHEVMGLEPVLWLASRSIIPWSVVLVDVWMWTPFMMLICLAGLSAIPQYLYEAADVDRASGWFRFRHITLPMVMPVVLIGVIFRIMDAYKMIDIIFVLVGDKGGAGRAAQTAALYVYDVAFKSFNTGLGSAYGYIMLIFIIALATLLIRAINSTKGE